ncbi:MAG TPA: hypothetical protein VN370_15020 [Desulfitobacteriaceae bacterium]|nr:hypothetical protein [Desulfitobacteriaceae bacterium]
MSIRGKIERLSRHLTINSPEEERLQMYAAMTSEERRQRIDEIVDSMGIKKIRELITELGDSPDGRRLREYLNMRP